MLRKKLSAAVRQACRALRITRTANAGVLLELDGRKIVLDGVCREVSPYLATSSKVRQSLLDACPDAVAVTHFHADHCDPEFESQYEKNTGRKVITPRNAGQTIAVDPLRLSVISSRHIGKTDCDHVSYILQGSKCLWFVGDAAPSQWKSRNGLPKADVLIAPFAYATTEAAWKISQEIAPKIMLLHFPNAQQDVLGLRNAVRQTVGDSPDIFIPEMGEFVEINF